jgi:Na+(H+)/acetate symporter ActP
MANPEIANLIGLLLCCQTLAAALSTAAGLLVISASVSHDIIKK